MLILHGCIFFGVFLGLRRKKLDRTAGILILCGNLLGLFLTAAGSLAGKTEVTELERQPGETREVRLEAEEESGKKEQILLEIPELQYTPTEARELL